MQSTTPQDSGVAAFNTLEVSKFKLGLLFAVLTAPVAYTASIEERLAELEKQTARLASENAALKKQLGYSADGKAPVLVVAGGKVEKLSLGGFIQTNAEFGDTPDSRWAGENDRFFLRRARINLNAKLAHDFSARIEADFGANALNAGASRSGQLTDAYVQWSKYDFANLRVGQFKTPFGHEQLAADTRILTIERSLPNDRLTVNRQIGVAASGQLATDRLDYQLGAFNGNGVNTGLNDNEQFMYAGRLSGLAYDGEIAGQKVKLAAGINGFTSDNAASGTTPANRRAGYGADVQLTSGPATLQAEWLRNENDALAEQTGWALLAAWTFNPNLRGVVRYENFDANTASRADTTTEVWTLGLDYLFKGDDLKISLNYLHGDQPAPTDDGGRLLARLQVIF